MSTQNDSQLPAGSAPTAAPNPVVPAAKKAAPETPGKKVPTFLKISIVLLAALSIAAISLLFIGDFEGKFERVFSTFIAFAVFVALTAFDTRRGMRNEWYPPVALLANSYILALLLIVVWMTPSGWSLVFDIFWKSLIVIVATRAVVGCAQLLLFLAEGKPKPLGVFAMITSLLATVTGILFTAPIAIDVFNVEIPDIYWRFAVAALLLTGLSLSISLLLRWSYGSGEREEARRMREAERLAAVQNYPNPAAPYRDTPAQLPAMPVAPHAEPAAFVAPAAPAAPVLPEVPAPAATPEQQLLPWPTFADGTPLPVGADGQPDFSALNR
ncbi:hypothetical protein QBL02_02960 [Leucobacter sp. UT-8R-CII-1-4]|uniref:hypothetical protein n=1 Tax=Leucobacter sp. UT-8R-CII-1-4 TaxID=3040075 RepID=UPI0024A9F8F9|nr:hypothetical protein [Leucobacter sp. UT-8R-CII-1-4]MDI6022499.1 hypothetical protein [Leucobacter sp. UT-8R-CII-1-4]